MEYESTGFFPISMKTTNHFPKWKNLDEYIDSMHGRFHGGFDPTHFDQGTLQAIKKEYGEGPVTQSKPIMLVYAVLTKLSN